jgi:Leucine-rich repeat (LRR) protein
MSTVAIILSISYVGECGFSYSAISSRDMTRSVHAHLAGTAALFLLVATIPPTTVAEVPSSEVDALLAWKASLAHTVALSSWTRTTSVCDHWAGVACDPEHVVGLTLEGLGLSGGLEKLDMAALPALTKLNLRGNNLVGDIPASISSLHFLEDLDLSNNGLSGSIPPQLADIRSLLFLQLSNNSLVGDIPHRLCRFLSAEVLALDLSNNRLTGDLRDCWCKLQVLQFMDLSKNRLTGKLPNCWWELPALRFMDLSDNSFSGEISTATSSNNCFLASLYLARNSFSGPFPPILQSCNSLDALDIGNNRFSGGIPAWIGSAIKFVRILSLRSNNFTGKIPPGFSQLFNLQLLDMANNSLTGSIPVDFGNLRFMMTPPGLSLPGLFQFRAPINQDRINVIWKRQQLVFQRSIWSLTSIDLSSNLLSHCIPHQLTSLQALRFLNLSRNHLSCGIPQDIGSLNSLEFLDLSCNELSGAIPPSITNISGLSTFNVSNNHLSGKIPVGSQIQTLTDPSIYSNNSGLCGFPLDILCTNTLFKPDGRNAPDGRNSDGEDRWLY